MQTSVGDARELARSLFVAAGMPEEPAYRTAWALVVAEAWGRASHGLMRIPFYLERFEKGGTDPRAELRVVRDSEVVACLDGSNGLGHWQVWHAAEEATRRAERFGIAAVSVANSGHSGVVGLYVLPMLAQNMIGLAFSNGPAVMPPWEGHDPLLSTSPLAAGIPTSPRPTIVDLATSAVARGRIAQAAAANEPIPEGWAFDREGNPTTDASVGLAGMVAPMGGAKGFALALVVEALTGGLAGPSLAGDIADSLTMSNAGIPQRSAHLVIAIDPRQLDGNGEAPERFALLARRAVEAGGRLPGAGHPLPDELDDELPIVIPDALGARIAAYATTYEVVAPSAFRDAPTP